MQLFVDNVYEIIMRTFIGVHNMCSLSLTPISYLCSPFLGFLTLRNIPEDT